MTIAGQIVLDYLEKKDISQAKLARMLKETPQNLGKKLRNDDISIHTLEKVSDALEHNFFEDLAKYWARKHLTVEEILREPAVGYGKATSLEGMIEAIVEKHLKGKKK